MLEPASPLTGFVAGSWLSVTARTVARENPGRADEIATLWCPSDAIQAHAAMEAAAAAFPTWSSRPLEERATWLETLTDAIEQSTEALALRITRENGKTLADARGEVATGLRDVRHLLAQARRDGSPEVVTAATSAVESVVAAEPVGVYLVITPWNFPLATILRKLFPALVYGNTVVIKPSELTPGPACDLFRLMSAAGAPSGVASLVPGYGSEIGLSLLGHPALRGLSFTGSTRVGLELARATAGRDVRLQLEMGGKNTLVVLADADLDAAVAAALTGGFSCAGQWCTGTGRIVVEQPCADGFCDRLVDRVRALHVGPGDAPETDVGPVATEERVEATLVAIQSAQRSGARVCCGGGRAIPAGGVRGHYLAPTVIDRVDESMDIFVDELFAPVLPVAVASDRDHAVRLANRGNYGLSASVFSADTAAAAAVAHRIEAGIVHVNLHTAYREPQLPVAAWRDSGRGVPECGRFARDFCTRPRAIYVRRA